MAIGAVALLALALAAPAKANSVVVRHAPNGRIDVDARNAPLADILDRIAQKTGMKLVYEGQAPRQRITLTLRARRPAEAVADLLQGQGLNYALVLDATATRVSELVVSGSGPPGGGIRPRPSSAVPEPEAAAVEENVGVPEVETTVVEWAGRAQPPADPGLPPGSLPPPTGPEDPAAPADGTEPMTQPLLPPTSYSHSPFGPKPVILVPPAPAPTPTPTPRQP